MIIVPLGAARPKNFEFPDDHRIKSRLFMGSWFVSGSAGKLTIDRGFVNGLQPVIGNDVIGGTRRAPQPVLETLPVFEDERCFVCIKMAVNETTGAMVAKSQAAVNESNLTISLEPKLLTGDRSIHLHPIAVLMEDTSMFQISYFDFLHISVVVNNTPRHLMMAS